MAYLKNRHADMEIGYVKVGGKTQLYVQCNGVRQYYGTLIPTKADKFMRLLERWDEAGGNDGETI